MSDPISRMIARDLADTDYGKAARKMLRTLKLMRKHAYFDDDPMMDRIGHEIIDDAIAIAEAAGITAQAGITDGD